MRNNYSLRNRHHDFNIERFKTRLTAKCCVVFVAVTQIIIRMSILIIQNSLDARSVAIYSITMPLLGLIALIVCFEYFLFKKIGPKVMNYSKAIDISLLVIFTAEWAILIVLTMIRVSDTYPKSLGVTSVFTFIDFAWRTLFLLFLIQGWKLISIPPTMMSCIVIGFAISNNWTPTVYSVLLGFPQMFYTIMMLYFLDKIKWKEVFTNTQQERWMQINEFVLNNIPENIVILDLGGEVNFVSDYCRSFMQKCHLSENPKDLFLSITDLYQQPDTEPSSPSNSSRQGQVTSLNIMLEPTTENILRNDQRLDSLEDLIKNFKCIVKTTHLQQRRFLIYNGKLRNDDNHHVKSIEIKISYIHQYEKEFIILIIRDTTQRDLLVTLEDNNKYKDQLLASVSHELRAPLNGTINLVESAVNDKNMPIHVRETLLIPALRSSKFLLHIINDILDMSQIKVQKLRLIFRSAKLEETLKEALQLVEVQAKKKGVELSLVIHPDIQGVWFSTDHLRLSQIVLNLLNNSIKFTQKGSIILLAEPTIHDPNLVKISVQDSGMGMTQENIKKLFSDYTHIEFAERKEINPTGVGLGLSIAYSLAKLLGPKGQSGITVESTLNEGSTFSFIIENKEEQIDPQDILLKRPPSDKSQSGGVPDEFGIAEPKILHQCFVVSPLFKPKKRPVVISSGSKSSKCTCPKILVVDDNPFNTMAFEAVLGSLNFKCDSVFDGHAAIDAILKRQQNFCGGDCKPYQVVFMDEEMPGLTGSETVQEIKRLQAQGMIPPMSIIGCTAHGSAEKVERFMKSGIDSCIHKPITANELKSILQNQQYDM